MAWYSRVNVKEFAVQLARDVGKRYSPEMERGKGKKISAKGISNIIEDIYEKAVHFKQEHRLGIIRTARLGNGFRWELKEMGYSDSFIEVVTEGLVVYLTRKPGATSSGGNTKTQREEKK